MREAYYFPHDYDARNDPKMQELLVTHGVAGIGIYWCIVEQLYEHDGYMPLCSCKGIAFALHVDFDVMKSVINDFGLFENDGKNFWSNSIISRINKRKELSNKRKQAIAKRWEARTDIQTEYNSNTIVSKNDTNVCANQQKEYNSNTIVSKSDTNVIQMNTLNNINNKNIINIKKEKVEKEKSPLTATSGSVSPEGEDTPKSKKKNNTTSLLMPDGIDEDYREIYTEWLMYRKEIKKPFASQRSVNQNYKELLKLSNNDPETAKAIINQSIANGWQGLFTLKNTNDYERIRPNEDYRRRSFEVTATCAEDYKTTF